MTEKSAIVIGSGFSGISAATTLASLGYKVTVLEKNELPGGRARFFKESGFTFDMGPSWYWMPDVFESYFARFGKKPSDYYTLDRLDPSYTVVFGKNDSLDLPANFAELQSIFESIEKGSGDQLAKFLNQASYKYKVGINQLVYKPGRSMLEFLNVKLLIDVLRMDVFTSFDKHMRKFFTHKRLLQLIEFPILFLGALASNTPALYSLMNYADIKLGTWYPKGGMYKVVEGMVALAEAQGVNFVYNTEVTGFEINNKKIQKVKTKSEDYLASVVVAGADYHHVDTKLLPKEFRNYSDEYWDKRLLAPSALIFYLGVNKKIGKLEHHTLFFDEDFGEHARQIYTDPAWPDRPQFYLCVPSKTDNSVAPEGMENIFVLIPVATNLDDTEETREKYYHIVMERLENYLGEDVRNHVVYKRSYAHKDFSSDYHSYKGNAYGLANTLMQTAILKPSLKNKNLKNLYYTGQLTVPGPGVPPSLISGQVVADEIHKDFKK